MQTYIHRQSDSQAGTQTDRQSKFSTNSLQKLSTDCRVHRKLLVVHMDTCC